MYRSDSPTNATHADIAEHERALRPLYAWAEPHVRPFREAVLSLLTAKARADRVTFDEDGLRESIDRTFLASLVAWTHRALLVDLGIARKTQRLHAASTEARFSEFIADIASAPGRARIQRAFPMLAPDTRRRARQISTSLIRLLTHVASDASSLAGTLGELGRWRSFNAQQGDRHNGGDAVARLNFERQVVFHKPRSGAVDVAFFRLLRWLREHGVQPDQRAASVLHRTHYSYAGEIEASPLGSPDEFGLYYRRYGGLIAIAYLIGARDLHCDNVIASGAYPVLIDLEAVFQPSWSIQSGGSAYRDRCCDTVLATRMLPIGEADGQVSDVSGLRYEPLITTVTRRMAQFAGTDQLRLTDQVICFLGPGNLPHWNGSTRSGLEYREQLTEGFESTYRGLLAARRQLLHERGPLAAFRRLHVRVLARPTNVYAEIIGALSHPHYLADPQMRASAIARLQADTHMQGRRRALCAAEGASLRRGDVPRLSTAVTGRDVFVDGKKILRSAFPCSGWEEVQRRVRRLSEADLQRQARLVRLAVESQADDLGVAEPKRVPPSRQASVEAMPGPDEFIAAARSVGDEILKRGFGGAGNVAHFQLEARDGKRPRLVSLDATLYDGLGGVALFLAQLGAISGQARFENAARSMLTSMRRMRQLSPGASPPISAFNGIAGWLYVLIRCASLWNESSLVAEALSWVDYVKSRVSDDTAFDMVGGSAGVLLVALGLDEMAPGKGAFELATACAEHLAAKAEGTAAAPGWPVESQGGLFYSGLGHGTAGIAAALAQYAAASGNVEFFHLAGAAIAVERQTYDNTLGVWRDVREPDRLARGKPAQNYAWCHGAPGIGIGRLMMPISFRDHDWHQDLERCVTATLQHGFLRGNCLCHGDWGNLELLIMHALQGSDAEATEWRRVSAKLLGGIPALLGSADWHGPDTGLMTGIAGVGYGLLRCAAPTQVPSVLALATERNQAG